MPYQDLPRDFESKYRSAWVDLPNEHFDPEKGGQYYRDYIAQLQHADSLGFDGICVNEHHCNAYGLMPSPNLMASILTQTTSNAALIVLGNSLALYQPPLRVAEEMAMLDIMSNGRLVAGFPVGTSMDTTFSYGQVPLQLRERHSEAHDLIMKSWSERKPFAFNGKYTKLRYVNIWPRPLQQPHPPVWIPGSGSLETWELGPQPQLRLLLPELFRLSTGGKGGPGLLEHRRRAGNRRQPPQVRLPPAGMRL